MTSSEPQARPNRAGSQAPDNRPPAWVRAADYLVLALIVLGAVVAVTGGGRTHLGSLRFNVTSPLRFWSWAAVVTVVRYVAAGQPPIHRTIPDEVQRWYTSTAFRAALLTTVTTRMAIFLVGYFAVVIFGYAPGAPPFRGSTNELLNLPYRWDAGWYMGIAREGYSFVENAGLSQQNIVFFPALPIATRIVAFFLGEADASWTIAATLVSVAAFFGGCTYLFLLARDELSEDESRTALWMLAAFPFAVFFGAVYTESLFLLGTTGAFYHARRAQFARAGVWAVIVGLTRPNGFLLCVPLAVMAISPLLPPRLVRADASADGQETNWRHVRFMTILSVMPLVGLLIYAGFVRQLTGDWLAWISGHAAWGRHYTGLVPLVTARYGQIATAGLYEYTRRAPLDVLNAVGVIFVLAAAWPVARRLGLAYAVFILINILPPLAAGGLLSAGRLSSVLFPAFIWLAAVTPARYRGAWIMAFAANQALNAAIFYTWRELF